MAGTERPAGSEVMEPGVSIVVPVLNERNSVGKVLQALLSQDYPGEIEIIAVDGGSTDGTLGEIEDLMGCTLPCRDIRLLHNQRRSIPFGLNLGYEAAKHQYLLRMDAHAYPPRHYVSTIVKLLSGSGIRVIVGSSCRVVPANVTPLGRAIAAVLSSPLCIGNASYRIEALEGDAPREVDTVPFASFHKAVWEESGGFDEQLPAAEDYDFNFRARRRGVKVWLVPRVVVDYEARGTLGGVARQYFRYGYWTCRMCLKHRSIISARKAAPALFLLSLVGGPLATVLEFTRLLWVLMIGCYVGVLLINSVKVSKREGFRAGLWSLVIVPIIHLAYGAGTVASMLKAARERW